MTKEVLAELFLAVSDNHVPNSGEGPMLIEIANALEQVDKAVERQKKAELKREQRVTINVESEGLRMTSC